MERQEGVCGCLQGTIQKNEGALFDGLAKEGEVMPARPQGIPLPGGRSPMIKYEELQSFYFY